MKVTELLSEASKWTEGALARSKDGSHIGPRAKGAIQWCLIGALRRCYVGKELRCARQRLRSALPADYSIDDFNDDPARTFADIRRVIEQAEI